MYGLEIVAEGRNLVVSFVDMSIADIDGQPSSASDAVLAAFRLPSFVVDDTGTVLELRGMDDMIDQLDDADVLTPELRAAVTDTVITKYWNTWAGFWAAMESIEEPRAEGVMPLSMGDSEFDTTIMLESLGSTADDLAMLRYTQTIEGDEFLRSIGQLFEASGNEVPSFPISASGHRIVTMEVTTDPSTLRPASAQFVMDVEVTEDDETKTQVESRTWTFDWQSSDCAPMS